MSIEDRKFNSKNKDKFSFIVDESILIECDFVDDKYYWTSLAEKEDLHREEITRDVAFVYYKFKLKEYKDDHRLRNYADKYAEIDIKIKYNQIPNSLSTEEEFENMERSRALQMAMNTITDKQRDRIEKHIVDGIKVTDMVIVEGVDRKRIFKSIKAGLNKLKDYLKNFND